MRAPRHKIRDSVAVDADARGWEFGGYYLDIPHPARGGFYYACRHDPRTRQVRRKSLHTVDPEAAKQALVALVAASPARSAEDAPHPRDVLTVHALDAYLKARGALIVTEGQAIRAVDLVAEYLEHIGFEEAPLSHWTPSQQWELARYLHERHEHKAGTVERVFNVISAAFRDAARVRMRIDPLGQKIEGAIVAYAPDVVVRRSSIARELRIAPARKGGFVPSLEEMARFIDALETEHLKRWIILALNTWARPAAITEFDPATQYDARSGAIDLNPPDRLQTNKQRPLILATAGLAQWLDAWKGADEAQAALDRAAGIEPRPAALLAYKRERVGTVKKAVKRIAREIGLAGFTQGATRRFMATTVKRLCPLVTRERRSLWLGHAVEEGSRTTDHYEAFDLEVLRDVAIATDFVMSELQKLASTPLFAVEPLLNRAMLRRVGARPMPKKARKS